MVGLAPVSALTSAASANFSSMVVAAPPCTNLPNRVPVLAKPQEGTSIRKLSRAFPIRSVASALFTIAQPLATSILHGARGMSIVRLFSNGENDIEKARTMHALDARHLYIGGRRWS